MFKKRKSLGVLFLLLVFILVGCSNDTEEAPEVVEEVQEADDGLRVELHKDEEVLLGKSYSEFSERERKLFDTLEKGDTISDTLKDKIQEDVSRLTEEKNIVVREEKLEKDKAMEEYKKKQAEKDKEKEAEAKSEEPVVKEEPIEVDRKDEISNSVKSIIKTNINNKTYYATILDDVRVNENLGEGGEGTYIVLVDLTFDVKNRPKTGNPIMKKQAADMAARTSQSGIEDIKELVIFWKDDYNNRTVKYAFEYKDGAFYFMDIAGE